MKNTGRPQPCSPELWVAVLFCYSPRLSMDTFCCLWFPAVGRPCKFTPWFPVYDLLCPSFTCIAPAFFVACVDWLAGLDLITEFAHSLSALSPGGQPTVIWLCLGYRQMSKQIPCQYFFDQRTTLCCQTLFWLFHCPGQAPPVLYSQMPTW